MKDGESMNCLNCQTHLIPLQSEGVAGKFVILDLHLADENGLMPIKDGLVVDLSFCEKCGIVVPRLPLPSQ